MKTETPISRRSFLELGAKLSVLMGLGGAAVPRLAEAAEELASGRAPVLWLQGQSCSGCSISLLDAETVSPLRLLTQYLSLSFHQTLSAATGHVAVETVDKVIATNDYLLIVEGAVPAGMPQACMFGEEPFTAQLLRAARGAKTIVAVGSCAAFGGVPGAENNPTGAVSVPRYLAAQGIAKTVVRVPGCPMHPDWLLGVITHALKFGPPPLDDLGRPKMFFSRLMHDQCPRFADYEREKFARTFGDEGCLFKLGCLGPVTHTDCALRQWNGGVNSCIRAGAPCIGCGSEQFVAKADIALTTKKRATQSTAKS